MSDLAGSEPLVRATTPLPRPFRRWFWSQKRRLWREFPGRAAHDLRWVLATSARRRRWVEDLDRAHPSWLFVVGLNNSGTTLLSGLLARFPGIAALPGEGQKLSFALPRPGEYAVSRVWGNTLELFALTEGNDPGPSRRLKYDWSFHLPPQSRLAMAKCTQYAVRTRWLQETFPGSSFIGIVRHPFAVCEGIRRRTGHSLSAAVRHWRVANERLLDDVTALDHHLLVRYEDLCESPERALAAIAGFLSMPVPNPGGVLDAPVEAPTVGGEAAGVRDFNPDSDAVLSDQERARITAEAGDLMRRLGYAPEAARVAGAPAW